MRLLAIFGTIGWFLYMGKTMLTLGYIYINLGISLALMLFLIINLIALVDIKPDQQNDESKE